MLKEIIRIANSVDSKGHFDISDKLDSLVKKIASSDDYHWGFGPDEVYDLLGEDKGGESLDGDDALDNALEASLREALNPDKEISQGVYLKDVVQKTESQDLRDYIIRAIPYAISKVSDKSDKTPDELLELAKTKLSDIQREASDQEGELSGMISMAAEASLWYMSREAETS